MGPELPTLSAEVFVFLSTMVGRSPTPADSRPSTCGYLMFDSPIGCPVTPSAARRRTPAMTGHRHARHISFTELIRFWPTTGIAHCETDVAPFGAARAIPGQIFPLSDSRPDEPDGDASARCADLGRRPLPSSCSDQLAACQVGAGSARVKVTRGCRARPGAAAPGHRRAGSGSERSGSRGRGGRPPTWCSPGSSRTSPHSRPVRGPAGRIVRTGRRPVRRDARSGRRRRSGRRPCPAAMPTGTRQGGPRGHRRDVRRAGSCR
ncbi:MAG: hypothetical protein JWR28_1156 [Modestobacter sp.]|nr:hypothetical protein [Modestobacter sp.]